MTMDPKGHFVCELHVKVHEALVPELVLSASPKTKPPPPPPSSSRTRTSTSYQGGHGMVPHARHEHHLPRLLHELRAPPIALPRRVPRPPPRLPVHPRAGQCRRGNWTRCRRRRRRGARVVGEVRGDECGERAAVTAHAVTLTHGDTVTDRDQGSRVEHLNVRFESQR